jgi:hypothetical protein
VGITDFLKKLFRTSTPSKEYITRTNVLDLTKRLGLTYQQLKFFQPAYQAFSIPKRVGGHRTIIAPDDGTRNVQRLVLRRILNRLKSHSCATGFEKGHSIVTNAKVHLGADVIVRMDIQDFFPTTTADRVKDYFRSIGWDEESTDLLLRICVCNDYLPQGAPTSPRLSNLVNMQMDARLAGLADSMGAAYTRYADDITYSLSHQRIREQHSVNTKNPKTLEPISVAPDHSNWEKMCVSALIRATRTIVRDYGYEMHYRRKIHVRRRHQRQLVTGLVVNDRVGLPRETRRRLRAVEHRLATGGEATLTEAQLAGWKALQHMIETQRN